MKHLTAFCFAFAASFAGWSSEAMAQRPTAPKLFPTKTLAYLRVDDTRDLKDKLSATGMGKMAADPEISPILGTFYSTFVGQLSEMQNAIGLNLDELLSIPNGEMAMALVATKTEPAFAVMLEVGDELPALQVFLDRIQRDTPTDESAPPAKQVGNIAIRSMGPDPSERFHYFIESGVFVGTNKLDYAEQLAMIWTGNGIDHKPLADNRDFTTIMSRCVGTEGERPQVSFFVDPLAMVRELGKGNNGTIAVLATLKTLGVDGIKGVGGSAIIAPNEFDSIIHGHLLLNTNRPGILKVLRPKSGSIDPEPWVSDQVISYMTMNWDFAKTIKAVQDIVDSFAGENTFENRVIQEGTKNIGIDLRKDLIEVLDDRVTMVQTIVPPKKINSQANVYCIHIKEASRMKSEVLPKFVEKVKSTMRPGTGLESKMVDDSTIYYLKRDRDERMPQSVRVPTPAFCVLDDQLMISDSVEAITEVVQFNASGDGLLSDSIEFKLVRDRIKAQLKNADVSIMAYQRPEETMRLFYDLATNPENIDNLEGMSENNPFFKAIVTAIKSKKLPPFDVIAKYLAPGGAFVVEEESGLHYTGFSMRRE
ncbi:MAG: hypothetical protein ACK5OB_08220 [Pirellula sp.]